MTTMTIDAAANTATAPKGWKVSTSGRSLDILSRAWLSRKPDDTFLSLEDMFAEANDRANRSRELVLNPGKLEVIAPEITDQDTAATARLKSNQLTLGLPSGDILAPSHWVFGQIAGLAKAPAAYLRTLPTSLVSDALQYGLRYNRPDDVKLYADDLEALAVTGPDFGRIYNRDVIAAVSDMVAGSTGDHRWKIPGMLDWSTGIYNPLHPVDKDTSTLYLNDKMLMIFLCQDLAPIEIGKLPNGEPDLVFRGFYVTQSEVGGGAFKLGAFYLRAVCRNRIFWGVEGFEELTMRHSKYAPERFVEEARPALESFANGSTTKLIEGVTKAREAKVAKDKAETLEWLGARDISRKRALAIYDRIINEERGGDEADREVSAWELAQGITAEARAAANSDDRMDSELVAKKLLDKVAAA